MTRARVLGCCIVLLSMLCGCARSPEARRDKFLAKGKEHLEKRDFSRARVEFANAAKAMPNDAEPYYQLGLVANGSGDYQAAVNAFQKALSLNPKHSDAKLRLTQIMAAAGDRPVLDEAEKNLRELLEQRAATPELLNTLAVAELRLGRTEDAVHTLHRSLGTTPGEFTASILLARARLAQNDIPGAEKALKEMAESSPKTAATHLVLGRFYVSINNVAEAERAFRRALEIDAKNEAAISELAILQNRLGRKKEAEAGLRQLSLASQEQYQPLFGYFLLAEGRRDEAVREFERLTREHPDSRAARTRLITTYYALNRKTEARSMLDAVIKNNGRDIEARLQRGQILTAEGKYADAESDLNTALQQNPDSPAGQYAMAKLHQARGMALRYRQGLTRTLELNPNLLFVRLELAGALIAARNAAAALDLLDRTPPQQRTADVLIQRNWALWAAGNMPEMRKGIDRGLSNARSEELLVQDGLWKLRAGNATGARASLEQALQLNPGDMRALAGLKQSFAAQRQLPAAVQKVKEYAAQQPKSGPVQQFLGFMLLGTGDRPAARAAFTAAKAADSKYFYADLALVQMDATEGKWDGAAERLNGLLASDPRNTTVRLWLGVVEMNRKHPGEALDHFRKVVEAEPANAQALVNLAYLLTEHANKPDEALQYATKAQELAPDRPEYQSTLGWVMYRKALYPSALPYLQRAATGGKDPVFKYRLAMAYARLGEVQRGRTVLADALKQNPNLPEARMAKELLASTR